MMQARSNLINTFKTIMYLASVEKILRRRQEPEGLCIPEHDVERLSANPFTMTG